jgi:flagellar biosynthesis GTPase FlhF
MNLKRFTGRTSREALALVRQAFGDDAVVMSTRPCPEGVEVLAMAPESVQQLERVGATPNRHAPARAARPECRPDVRLNRGPSRAVKPGRCAATTRPSPTWTRRPTNAGVAQDVERCR